MFVAALWIVLAYLAMQLWPWLLLLAPVLFALVARMMRHGIVVLWLAGVLLALGIGAWRENIDQTNRAFLGKSVGGSVEAVALTDSVGSEDFWQVPARLDQRGPKVWLQGRGEMPVEGSVIRTNASLDFPEAPRNPGEFDRRKWMRQQGLEAIVRQNSHAESEVVTGATSLALARARASVRTAITRGLDEESTGSKVILAVVLGEKPKGDSDLLEDFRHSGSMHVFSVSGLHVGMVAVLVWMVAAATGLNRRWLVVPVILLVFAYAWLTGANAPAVRAAWMAAVFLGAFCFRRRPDLPNALGAVLLILLIWDVRQLHQPSVQLSYGVVTAIAFGLPWTTRWFSRIGAAPLLMPIAEIRGLKLVWWRLRQWLAGTLSVSTAASIGATPLTLWHFGLVTPVSVIAALLMLPLVFGVMALAMVSMLLSPIEPAGSTVNRLNEWLAGGCAKVAGWMAEVPGGHWKANQEQGPVLWVYSLKEGDASAIWVPQKGDAGLLIDCGGRNSFRYPLLSSLQRLGLQPDSMILTHPDGGHLGGGHAVWRELPIRQALMAVEEARSPAHRAWSEQAFNDGVELLMPHLLQQGLVLGEEARIEWLHLPNINSQNLAADHRVLVMRLHWGKWKILWLSDAGSVAEQAMLESGRDLSADVIVAGRHRSDLSMSDAFVEVVSPRAIVIDNDTHPEGEGFSPQQIRSWRDAGITVFDQSECGAVSIRPDDESLHIEGFVNGHQLRLK